ncbi:hypothetical protein [Pseudonocardia sp. MH-G8]|uniref:hypothetical protein n=1 Tax=Pseudonocardia sp. MH-G8 TaxID=1854588 RepID=UPI000BA0D7BC|nr:hypothetical protein [Pseudonocardia sp. MH-G8]OZM75812.1 hypothetical protein CFP66_44520 [Pseudonocardia sp. MH-G8]
MDAAAAHPGGQPGHHGSRLEQVNALSPNNINNVRLERKRLAGRGFLAETDPDLFTQPRP